MLPLVLIRFKIMNEKKILIFLSLYMVGKFLKVIITALYKNVYYFYNKFTFHSLKFNSTLSLSLLLILKLDTSFHDDNSENNRPSKLSSFVY